MPDATPAAPNPSADPTRDSGDVGDPMMHCDQNDVEAVCDLDEPNSVEIESEFEDDEPMGLLFTASATDADGQTVELTETPDGGH